MRSLATPCKSRVTDRRADRRHSARLAATARPRRRSCQSRTPDAALPHLARRRPPDPQRPPAPPQDLRGLALGNRDCHRLGPDHRPVPSTLTSTERSGDQGKNPGTLGTPGDPARQPGHRHSPTLKSRFITWPGGHPRPATDQRESSGLARSNRPEHG